MRWSMQLRWRSQPARQTRGDTAALQCCLAAVVVAAGAAENSILSARFLVLTVVFGCQWTAGKRPHEIEQWSAAARALAEEYLALMWHRGVEMIQHFCPCCPLGIVMVPAMSYENGLL